MVLQDLNLLFDPQDASAIRHGINIIFNWTREHMEAELAGGAHRRSSVEQSSGPCESKELEGKV